MQAKPAEILAADEGYPETPSVTIEADAMDWLIHRSIYFLRFWLHVWSPKVSAINLDFRSLVAKRSPLKIFLKLASAGAHTGIPSNALAAFSQSGNANSANRRRISPAPPRIFSKSPRWPPWDRQRAQFCLKPISSLCLLSTTSLALLIRRFVLSRTQFALGRIARPQKACPLSNRNKFNIILTSLGVRQIAKYASNGTIIRKYYL